MRRLAGPSLLALAASLTAAAAAPVTFTSDGSTFQSFTAPADGTYDVVAFGAQGGGGFDFNNVLTSGGLGAEIGGDFVLTAGETLSIAVGIMGVTPAARGSIGSLAGGGGGGSFVVGPGGVPLVIAGGGGGSYFTFRGDGGQVGTAGSGPSGGTAGGGGGGNIGSQLGGGGGGGFKGDGATNSARSLRGGLGGGGYPGLLGGYGVSGNPSGGFGGGGGGGGGMGGSGGGGGGYSGGDGNEGGGGSFDAGTNQVLVGGFNSGDGSVVITALSATAMPEPASLALLCTGLLGLGLAARRRMR